MQPKGQLINFQNILKYFQEIPVQQLNETDMFIKDNHFQNWKGWIGWKPDPKSATYAQDLEYIKNGFTSKNVCGGIVKRLEGAVFGRQPDWQIVAKDAQEKPLGSEQETENEKIFKNYDAPLMQWWTDKNVHHFLKEFIRNRASFGKAGIRIYIPKGFLNSEGSLKGNTFEEILNSIYIDVPNYSCVVDVKDKNYGKDLTLVELEKTEILLEGANIEAKQFEVCYLDAEGDTVLKNVIENQKDTVEIKLDLGGNLLTFVNGEYDRALISNSVKSMQRQVNHAKTMEGYALQGINFPETVFLNATMPKETVKTASGALEERFKAIFRGVGRWINLRGDSYEKADGSEGVIPADVKWRTPADPEKFAKVATNNEKDIHAEAGMLYVFLADSEYASGNSKIEAMTDYIILLVDSKTVGDALLTWLLETVIRLVHHFMKKQYLNNLFKVIASTKLTLGRISVEERMLMLTEVEKGLRDKESYIISAEVSDDAKGTLNLIEIEQLKDFKKQLEESLQSETQSAQITQKFASNPANQPAA